MPSNNPLKSDFITLPLYVLKDLLSVNSANVSFFNTYFGFKVKTPELKLLNDLNFNNPYSFKKIKTILFLLFYFIIYLIYLFK